MESRIKNFGESLEALKKARLELRPEMLALAIDASEDLESREILKRICENHINYKRLESELGVATSQKTDNCVFIGRHYFSGQPVYLPFEIAECTCIFGISGQGKSQLGYLLIDGLYQIGKKVIYFDSKMEGRRLISYAQE